MSLPEGAIVSCLAKHGARVSRARGTWSVGDSVGEGTEEAGRAAETGRAAEGQRQDQRPNAASATTYQLAERGLTLMSGALSPMRRSKAALTRHLHRLEYGKRIETSGRWIGMEPTFRQKYSSTSRAFEVPELLRAKTAGASAMQRGAAAAEMMSRYP